MRIKDPTYKRHLAKTLTWRVVGTLDTVLLSWLISGDPFVGFQIGMAEVLTKLILYYFHERIWFKLNLEGEKSKSQIRHLLKTLSWRVVGTLDTMLLAWLISGDVLIGLKIGLVEVITKMTLYYFHERFWYKVDYGLPNRQIEKNKINNNEYNSTEI